MISVTMAQTLVERTSRRLMREQNRIEQIPLTEALGRFLAQSLTARFDVPRFDNSAMDGFALRSIDSQGASKENTVSLKIIGTIAAGDTAGKRVERYRGIAIRIMTGAPIPPGADTVVKKEDVMEQGKGLLLFAKAVSGQNIRHRGEDIRSGQRAAEAHTQVTPGTAAFLASAGIETVAVFALPRVSIIVTGNELIEGNSEKGTIVDSNSLFLKLALKEMGLTPQRVRTVADDPGTLKKIFARSFQDSDVAIVTGGVSVGERDYTKGTLARCGVKTIFWQVAQKPGKPLFFGTHKNRMIFGLPGNPYAVVACFYLYVRPALMALMGRQGWKLPISHAHLDREFVKSDDKVHFLKGAIVRGNGGLRVKALAGQGSHLLSTMTRTHLLIEIPAQTRKVREGRKVRVHFL